MYKSPIEMIYGELQTQMAQEEENTVMKAVRQIGVNVDKGELIKVLQYDRNQYTKGYEDGKNEVLDKIRAEIHATAEMHEDGNYYLRDEWIDEIFDKYKVESEVQDAVSN